MIKIGLLGQPNAGKSTLFNLLTAGDALTADYPFTTVIPNKGMYRLFDPVASNLAEAIHSPDIRYSEIEIWDIAGLVENASMGEGLGNEFLGQIKDCNVLFHVIRGGTDQTKDTYEAQKELIVREIALFDHKLLLKPFEKARRLARLYPGDTAYANTNRVLTTAYYESKKGLPVREVLQKDDMPLIADIGLVSDKPRLEIHNSDDSVVFSPSPRHNPAALEANLLDLDSMKDLNAEECRLLGYERSALDAFLAALSENLLLLSGSKRFYTVGHLGVGQSLIDKEASALECSRLVHADLAEHIRHVSVTSVENFKKTRNWAELGRQGLVKKFGLNYVPRDRDVLLFE